MKKFAAYFGALLVIVSSSGHLKAFQHHSVTALWIETKEHAKTQNDSCDLRKYRTHGHRIEGFKSQLFQERERRFDYKEDGAGDA